MKVNISGKYNWRNTLPAFPGDFTSFIPIFVFAIHNIRNIKYRYVSKTVATNVDRDFIESIAVKLLNKKLIFNKPTVQGLDSYFIVNIEENYEVKNSTFAYEKDLITSMSTLVSFPFPFQQKKLLFKHVLLFKN